jgi:type IV pilus assembly protein PilC
VRYRSTYLAADGGTSTALLDATDEQSLHEHLHRQGCTLLRVEPVGERAVADKRIRLHPRQQLAFVQSLNGALDAGVPLLTVLQAMEQQEPDPTVAAMLTGIAGAIASGATLADAMAGYPRAFPMVMSAMVRAGEQSGMLPKVLASLVGFLEWKMAIAGTVRQALVYPLVVGTAGYGLLLFLLAFVIPKLGGILSKIGGQLPTASRFLVAISGAVADHVLLIALGSVAAAIGLAWLARTDTGRVLFAGVFARLPVASGVLRTFSTAQLCRNLSVLLHAGLTMTEALELAAAAIAQRSVRTEVAHARDRILGGSKITDSLADVDLLPPVAMSMVRVGEDAGRLPETFEHLSGVYDREVKDKVARALSLLEPLVTVVLGLAVGGVAVLVISTVYTAMRGLGK